MTYTIATLLPLFIQLTGKVATLLKPKTPTSDAFSKAIALAQQAGAAAELIKTLQVEGRDESTEEEAADLQAVLAEEDIEDLRFDADQLKAAKAA